MSRTTKDNSDSRWIQRAIKRKGSLHEALHVPMSKKIPDALLQKASHSRSPLMRERANLAKNLKRFNRSG